MKPINIFDIDNYIQDYLPVVEYINTKQGAMPYCSHFTSSKNPIEYASSDYVFANLPIKNSCSSSDRLAQVSMNRIWTCPDANVQVSCSYYRADVYKISTTSLFDAVGSEIVYDLIKLRNQHGYTYFIYNKTRKNITQIYTISYENDLIDDKAIEIFKQHLSESYDSVSSFITDYAFNVIEKDFSVPQNQKENSFLLSLVSTE